MCAKAGSPRTQTAVHEGHGLFRGKVGFAPQALDDDVRAELSAQVHEKAGHGNGAHALEPFDGRLGHGQPPSGVERVPLGGVEADGEDHFVGEGAGAHGDVHVPQGDGIEGSGIHGDGHASSLAGETLKMRVSPKARSSVVVKPAGQAGSGEREDLSTTATPSGARTPGRRARTAASRPSSRS